MNRTEEYRALLSELDFAPSALNGTAFRAKARLEKRRRSQRAVSLPLGSLCAVFAAFVLLVNVSLPFARACGRVPVLRELAAAVSFSPSLSAAVEHEYVQPILQKQTENGITMRVEYVIVDQKQLNIFYSLDSERYGHLDADSSVGAADGGKLEGYSFSSGYGQENGALRKITVDFVDAGMPDRLNLTCRVYDRGEPFSSHPVRADDALPNPPAEPEQREYLAVFTFPLSFDPAFTQQGKTYALNQSFQLAGQKLTATTAEVYPTHVRLNLIDDENNTAWLKSLTFYLEDEAGKRYEPVGSGITATGSPDSPTMTSHRLESAFFSGSRRLSITITGAVLLDKNMERVRIDLAGGKADSLPEGVRLEETAWDSGAWMLTFSAPAYKENATYQLFNTDYYDEAGNKYEFDTWMSGSYSDGDAAAAAGLAGRFETRFRLSGYPYDTVYLSPLFSRSVKAEVPIVLEVR